MVSPLLRNDYVYHVAMTKSLDLLRTRRTIKTTRIQLNELRARMGTGVLSHEIRPGMVMEFDLSQDLDAFMYDYLSKHGHYEREVESTLASCITKDTTFIDVGANVGYFTLLFSGSARVVYAFEPVPAVFERLARNIELNGLTNVRAVRSAVSRERGKLRLFESSISAGHDSTVRRYEHQGSLLVDSVTLDESVESPSGGVVMKVDVEGSEMDVLIGARGLIRSGKVSAIVLEWARDLYPRVTDLRDRFSLYSSLGTVEVLDERVGSYVVRDRREVPEVCNLLIRVGG